MTVAISTALQFCLREADRFFNTHDAQAAGWKIGADLKHAWRDWPAHEHEHALAVLVEARDAGGVRPEERQLLEAVIEVLRRRAPA